MLQSFINIIGQVFKIENKTRRMKVVDLEKSKIIHIFKRTVAGVYSIVSTCGWNKNSKKNYIFLKHRTFCMDLCLKSSKRTRKYFFDVLAKTSSIVLWFSLIHPENHIKNIKKRKRKKMCTIKISWNFIKSNRFCKFFFTKCWTP